MLKKININTNESPIFHQLEAKIQTYAFYLKLNDQKYYWIDYDNGNIYLENMQPYLENFYDSYGYDIPILTSDNKVIFYKEVVNNG